MDKLVGEYYKEFPGPLGSTDRKYDIDIDALFEELNTPDSKIASMWTDKEITDWTKTLGAPSSLFTQALNGSGVCTYRVPKHRLCINSP